MGRDKYGHYVNDKGVTIKVTEDKNGKTHASFYDKSVDEPHSGIHVNVDKDSKSYNAKYHDENGNDDGGTSHSGGCYLTSACMEHYTSNFDDNCYELNVLRNFRDKYVSKKDIDTYYNIAPKIVQAIEKMPNSKNIFIELYDSIVRPCVDAIDNNKLDLAYCKYKNSILDLEEQYL